MKTSTKLFLTVAFISIGLGGLARTVYASQSNLAVAVMPQNQSKIQIAEASDGDGEVPDATEASLAKQAQAQSSVINKTQVAQQEASDGDGEVADDTEEQQESARLQAFAQITPQQAQESAQASLGGTASRVKLDDEDSNLVYKVTIAKTEVAVDAGNGKVLYTENVNQEDNPATEAKRPKSSIQVPDKNDGDKEVKYEKNM